MNPYAVLGVPHDSTQAAISSAYKALALQAHPDRKSHGAASAGVDFSRVTEAYRILSDPQKRAEYDTRLNLNFSTRAASALQKGPVVVTRNTECKSENESATADEDDEEYVPEKVVLKRDPFVLTLNRPSTVVPWGLVLDSNLKVLSGGPPPIVGRVIRKVNNANVGDLREFLRYSAPHTSMDLFVT